MTSAEWIVIVNADGTALGIYGPTLREQAEKTLAKINDGMPEATHARLVRYRAGARPQVGQIIK